MVDKKLKIAYYCSNRTVFPPPNEKVAANAAVMWEIVRKMIEKGHDVTVYASKGSHVPGEKVVDLGLPPHQLDSAYLKENWVPDLHAGYRLAYISEMIARSDEYDIIHLHVGRAAYGLPFIRFSKCPVVFTIHENLVPEMEGLMNRFRKADFVSISDAQRKNMPSLHYAGTVHNGIPVESFPFCEKPEETCLFMSRVAPEKGIEDAIAASQRAKASLRIYGPGKKEYLESSVMPNLDENISYFGMAEKFSEKWFNAYLQAKVLLFPIQWDEPFGLVMIEAMACGTPVIAYGRGSVLEIIQNGKTGYICKPDDIAGMAAAIRKIYAMPEDEYLNMRRNCRAHVERNFSSEKMAEEYLGIYQKLLKAQPMK